jgi:acetyl-CoA carboxylase carboxyl transferase subunit alpha
MKFTLDFEKPLEKLEERLRELKLLSMTGADGNIPVQIKEIEEKICRICEKIYSKLTPWQIVQIARHPSRPRALDFINGIFENFEEIHGDRNFRDDPAIVCGFGEVGGKKVAIIAQERGRAVRDRAYRNFGMAHPEGYRKAMRVMKLAERFSLPLITFVDTPGAYPGIGAEERGQAPAIGESIMTMFNIKTPTMAIVIGEGGSGGALAISVADRIYMLKYAIYSVISPEGCSSILWRTSERAHEAAKALKLTADDLLSFGLIDRIIEEPPGGAHRYPDKAISNVKESIVSGLNELVQVSLEELINMRYYRYRSIGIKNGRV